MFTGIVEELGCVASVTDLGDAARLAITGPVVTADAAPGDSIAVNGVCLTVVDVGSGVFTADVMQETLRRSSLGALVAGSPVNLERAARIDSRLGGHIVQGHVDGTATVTDVEPSPHWTTVRFAIEPVLARYVVEKGSITVDGVSLTVVAAGDDSISVSLIPTTLEHTTLGTRQRGDIVNIEVDVIAKYVERLMEGRLS
ncbi:MAG: riboflavin synthase [Actinobacteria bacterium]|jgi:riboflavin synthase|nr:riboflavin synthase [Actinomycetota bacterium]